MTTGIIFRYSSAILRKRTLHTSSHQWISSNVNSNLKRIGFIGLGNMGRPMARNIIAKGHKLVVYDTYHTSMSSLKEFGASLSKSPQELTTQVECVITMLPNNASVMEVYEGENGILKSVQKGTLLIDSSTIDPSVSQTIAARAEDQGAVFLDAPVSGGVNAAKSGQLTFMVGGKTEAFPMAEEILLTMGSRVVHCGSVGSGQAAKICNNMLLGISMVGTAEAMNLGIKLGLDPKILINILNSSSGRCWSSEVYSPVPGTMTNVPSANEYKGGFGTKLMAKDLGLAQEAATRTSTPTPLGSLAHQMYSTMINNGYAEKDFSSVFQFFQEQERNS